MQFTKTQSIFVPALVCCMMSLLMFPQMILAQTLRIPDTNLRAAIAEALDKPQGAKITVGDMQTLEELRAEGKDIESLEGIEAATNLHRLYLYNNSISDLSPLSGLTELRHLGLNRNLIEDLSPLEGLINVRRLELAHNLIFDLSPLAGLLKLRWLGMTDNPIADLEPLSGLTSLEHYHSWGTPVFNLSALVELPKLRDINICGGEISDISFLGKATGLQELYFAGNDISDISALANLTNLTRLSLEHNDVSDLSPLESLKKLKWIDLRDNAVSDVSPLAELEHLTWLDLSENRITDVSALTSLQRLTWLGLAGNTITDESALERFSGVTSILYSNFVNSVMPPAGLKIEGPWLWAIVPGAGLGNTDLLSKVTGGAATEVKVSTFGAKEDKAVGDSKWTAHSLSPTGNDNLNEMTAALGWGTRHEIYDHVVYGSVTLNSPRKQDTKMLVGSNDGVKVWLNGELVHYNPVIRGAGDYQDTFPVTLKKGANVLLVAVDNHGHGDFSGFFGFAKDTDYTVNPPERKIVVKVPAYDVNQDGITNILDIILVGQDLGKTNASNARTDVNRDKKRDIRDLVLVANHLGEISGIAAAPSLWALNSVGLEPPAQLQAWIAQAQAESDGSRVFQQGIANLQRLLAARIPHQTRVLANYPNPFNPETWIPYQLAEPANVTVRIYTVGGTWVRTLDLGHQVAGRYQEPDRAAYWDGTNALGEPVASGLYFYTLTADDFTATRKMLIRK